jgi:hypothetical protein
MAVFHTLFFFWVNIHSKNVLENKIIGFILKNNEFIETEFIILEK